MLSRGKRVLFTLIMVAVPLAVPPALLVGYYAVQKLVAPAEMVGSYGEIDAELGWRLKANATSRYRMEDRLASGTLFDSRVYTDAQGFRSAPGAGDAPTGAIVAIGDSWTFGYGVDYEDAFPARLERLLGEPVVNMAVPAYGTAQALLLLERHVARIGPRAVVYLDLGLWQRSLCHGAERPRHILKPCFWRDPGSGEVEIVAPRPGYVEAMARRGVYPGGWLTAGNTTWTYYLVSRPVAKVKQLLTAAGLFPGHRSEYDSDPVLGRAARAFALRRFAGLARRHGFVFVLVDPYGHYRDAVAALGAGGRRGLSYFSPELWAEKVDRPASGLPPGEARVPKDGHYAAGMHGIIARALADHLAPLLGPR